MLKQHFTITIVNDVLRWCQMWDSVVGLSLVNVLSRWCQVWDYANWCEFSKITIIISNLCNCRSVTNVQGSSGVSFHTKLQDFLAR